MDIFIFDTSILEETQFPPFQIGELGWDSFFAAKARVLGIPFIDATAKVPGFITRIMTHITKLI